MEMSDKVLAQGTMKLAQSPVGIEPRSSEPKSDAFKTVPISLTHNFSEDLHKVLEEGLR